MYKKLSVLSLFAPLLLVGCGTADLDGLNEEEITDTVPPGLTQIYVNGQPAGGGTLSNEYLYSVAFQFNEAIDISLLKEGNVLVAGYSSPALSGSWGYNATDYTLTFSLNTSNLGFNSTGSIILNADKIADLAGNFYLDGGTNQIDRITYATPKALNARVTVNGLLTSNTPTISVKNISRSGSPAPLVFSSTNNSQLFSTIDIVNGQQYSVSIANSNQVCHGAGTFTMGTTTPTININCSDVMPYFTNASYWNDRLQGIASLSNPSAAKCTDSLVGCFNGSLSRRFDTNQSTTCTDITATDDLGVFEWACQVKADNSGISLVSTGIMAGKGLKDLVKVNIDNSNITNSTASWLPNRVNVTQASIELARSASSVWWPNSVNLINTPSLSGNKQVHVYSPNMGITQLATSTTISTNGLSLVIPTGTFNGNVTLHGPHSDLWVEGDFAGASTVIPAISISGTSNTTLHNVRVLRSNHVGIALVSTTATHNSSPLFVSNAAYDGLRITKGKLNMLDNVTLVNNGTNGLMIQNTNSDGWPDNAIENVHAYNNGFNGIELKDARNNHLILISTSSNAQNGLHFSKATAGTQGSSYNYIGQLTSINNGGAGISAIASPKYNTINGAFVALNGAEGVVGYNDYLPAPAISFVRSQFAHNAGGSCNFDNTPGVCPIGINVDNAVDLSTVFAGIVGTQTAVFNVDFSIALPAFQGWTDSSIDLVNGTSGGSCSSTSTYCKLVDWSVAGNTVTNTFPGVETATTSATFVYAENAGLPKETLYQPTKVDHINDNLGDKDAFCNSVSTCSDAITIGHFQLPVAP